MWLLIVCWEGVGKQSIVGDKAFAFLLMNKEMYFNMSSLRQLSPVVDRGIALHKVQLLVFIKNLLASFLYLIKCHQKIACLWICHQCLCPADDPFHHHGIRG
jgi:hypothetical protein